MAKKKTTGKRKGNSPIPYQIRTAKVPGKKLFGSKRVAGVDSVRVYDIGQGDCVALMKNGKPIMYVDYGGFIDHPDQGNYSNVSKRLPIPSTGVPIVLTHWDHDHYYSARKNSKARGKDARWLAPRQLVGPSALKFATSLTDLKCWPASLGRKYIRFSAGSGFEICIAKCGKSPTVAGMAEDRNLTGLSITVLHKDVNGTVIEYVLLPGDAPFHKIPNLNTTPSHCLGMLAYHHGSHNHWNASTTSTLPSHSKAAQAVVFSYGQHNPYGHPDKSNYSSWQKKWKETPRLRSSRVKQNKHIDINFNPRKQSPTGKGKKSTVTSKAQLQKVDRDRSTLLEIEVDEDGQSWISIGDYWIPLG